MASTPPPDEAAGVNNGSRKRPRRLLPNAPISLSESAEVTERDLPCGSGQQSNLNTDDAVGTERQNCEYSQFVAKDFLSAASSEGSTKLLVSQKNKEERTTLVTTQNICPGGLSTSMLPSVLDMLSTSGGLADNDLLMVRMDPSGVVKEWNDTAADMIGYSREETLDKGLIDNFVIPELRPMVQKIFEDGIKGQNYKFCMETKTKDNGSIFLLVNTSPVRDPNDENKIVGLMGYARDVTKEVLYDMSVRSLCADHKMIIEKANAPVFGVNQLMQVSEWNEYSIATTGYPSREVLGHPFVETLISRSYQASARSALKLAFDGKQTENVVLGLRTKGGEDRIWDVKLNPRFDPCGKVFGVIGVAQDVTKDRKLEKELQLIETSSKAKLASERGVTAYFAHELRNPLHAIDSALQAMPDDMSDATKNLVSAMQLCTNFMSSVMNNLLDVRKMEEGKMILKSEPISVSRLLKEAHDMLAPSVRKGVQFLIDCRTNEKDWVMGDFHRIEQVITNISTNSIKYTTAGRITLGASWEDDSLKLEIVDTGPGIPKNEQEKIFEKFVQGGGGGGAPGTGLGLAICKNIVDLCGGSIRFESDPTVKPGTACIILLPLAPCKAPSEVSIQDEETVIEDNLSFLIIDDVAINRTMLNRRLKKCIAPNASVQEASNGEEGLELCQERTYDVIMVDHNMRESGGVMLGTDVVIAMRRKGISSIIIGCSGADSDEAFKDAGCDLVWGKPMPSNAEVIKQLSKLLCQKKKAVE